MTTLSWVGREPNQDQVQWHIEMDIINSTYHSRGDGQTNLI